MEQFDLAVIGAGPAGNFAAYEAAKLGLSTAVFEEHEKIGEPVHCGECLSHAACERIGLELPSDVISMDAKGIRLYFPDKSHTSLSEKGYTLEKEKFEQYLSSIAADEGASYKMRHRVSGLSLEGGTWKISTTSGEYSAKVIIDASGSEGAASRLLKMNPSPKKVVGLQYELSPVESDGFIDFFVWPRLAPHGYLWVIPKKNGRANVGLVCDDATLVRRNLDAFVGEWGLREKKNAKAFGGFIPASGPVRSTYSDGIMLTGDAAGFTSPMFEGGTALAMTSGKFAAQVAAEAIRKGDTSRAALAKYEKLWRMEFPDYSRLVGGKDAFYRFSDSELNQISSILPPDLTDVSLLGKARVGAAVLARFPGLLAKGFVPAMDALGYSRAKYYGW